MVEHELSSLSNLENIDGKTKENSLYSISVLSNAKRHNTTPATICYPSPIHFSSINIIISLIIVSQMNYYNIINVITIMSKHISSNIGLLFVSGRDFILHTTHTLITDCLMLILIYFCDSLIWPLSDVCIFAGRFNFDWSLLPGTSIWTPEHCENEARSIFSRISKQFRWVIRIYYQLFCLKMKIRRLKNINWHEPFCRTSKTGMISLAINRRFCRFCYNQ